MAQDIFDSDGIIGFSITFLGVVIMLRLVYKFLMMSKVNFRQISETNAKHSQSKRKILDIQVRNKNRLTMSTFNERVRGRMDATVSRTKPEYQTIPNQKKKEKKK